MTKVVKGILNAIILFIILFATWVAFSGYLEPFFLISGAISSAIAAFFAYRMSVIEKEYFDMPLYLHFSMWGYSLWLLREIVSSSLATAKIMWHIHPQISPTLACIKTIQKNDVGRVLYANSITLTPGTVSIMVEDEQILVHALCASGVADLETGEMDEKAYKVTEYKAVEANG